jgi:hypothetical protein
MEGTTDIFLRLKEINEISFSTKLIPIPENQLSFGENLTFTLGFHSTINEKREEFIIRTNIKFLLKGEESPFLELETELKFEIKELASIIRNENGVISIEDGLMEMLTGICIGTTRGMLAAKTSGKVYSTIPLPLLNPADVLQQMKDQSE